MGWVALGLAVIGTTLHVVTWTIWRVLRDAPTTVKQREYDAKPSNLLPNFEKNIEKTWRSRLGKLVCCLMPPWSPLYVNSRWSTSGWPAMLAATWWVAPTKPMSKPCLPARLARAAAATLVSKIQSSLRANQVLECSGSFTPAKQWRQWDQWGCVKPWSLFKHVPCISLG